MEAEVAIPLETPRPLLVWPWAAVRPWARLLVRPSLLRPHLAPPSSSHLLRVRVGVRVRVSRVGVRVRVR